MRPTCTLGVLALVFHSVATNVDRHNVAEHSEPAQPKKTSIERPRVLYAIAMFDFRRWAFQDILLGNAVGMCEAGMNVTVEIDTTARSAPGEVLAASLRSRHWCFLADEPLHVRFFRHPAEVELQLVNFHRVRFYEQINDFDLFIYGEDDMSITATTIRAFLHFSEVLQGTHFIPGFVRFEYSECPGVDAGTQSTERSIAAKNAPNISVEWNLKICERVYWEHLEIHKNKNTNITMVDGKPYWELRKPFQAAYLLTREQLIELDKRCDFRADLSNENKHPGRHREHIVMQAYAAYQSRSIQSCPYRLVLPIQNFEAFAIRHLPGSNHKRPGRHPIAAVKARKGLESLVEGLAGL